MDNLLVDIHIYVTYKIKNKCSIACIEEKIRNKHDFDNGSIPYLEGPKTQDTIGLIHHF